MSGRQLHWIAASTAAVAVIAAVVFNDTSSDNSFRAHPFTVVGEFTPEVGQPVLATPTLDATTVQPATSSVHLPGAQARHTTSPSVPKPPPPPPPPPPPLPPPGNPPRVTLPITVPAYFPDCQTAWLLGAAPIRRGEPGYRRELDRNDNGVACER